MSEKSPEELVKGKDSGEPDLPSSEASGDLGEVRPADMPDLMPKAGMTTLDYDDEMRLTSVKDAAGATSTLSHDPVGRMVGMRRPLDVSAGRWINETMAYDRNGNLRQSVDGRDHATTTVFDGFDRPVERTEPGSNEGSETTKLNYDANDKVTREETPRGVATAEQGDYTKRTEYDRIDRTLAEINPAGEKTTYDEFGRMKKGTGPDGKEVSYTYDALDRRDTKSESGQAQDMSYVGTSESLSEEVGAGKDRLLRQLLRHGAPRPASGDGAEAFYHAPARRRRGAP